jgi:hypothetical protein
MSRIGAPRGEHKRPFYKTNQRRMKQNKINALCADLQPRPFGRAFPPLWRSKPNLVPVATGPPVATHAGPAFGGTPASRADTPRKQRADLLEKRLRKIATRHGRRGT